MKKFSSVTVKQEQKSVRKGLSVFGEIAIHFLEVLKESNIQDSEIELLKINNESKRIALEESRFEEEKRQNEFRRERLTTAEAAHKRESVEHNESLFKKALAAKMRKGGKSKTKDRSRKG